MRFEYIGLSQNTIELNKDILNSYSVFTALRTKRREIWARRHILWNVANIGPC